MKTVIFTVVETLADYEWTVAVFSSHDRAESFISQQSRPENFEIREFELDVVPEATSTASMGLK